MSQVKKYLNSNVKVQSPLKNFCAELAFISIWLLQHGSGGLPESALEYCEAELSRSSDLSIDASFTSLKSGWEAEAISAQ